MELHEKDQQALAVYANKQEEEMSNFTIGAKDDNGDEIEKIYARDDEFVVYKPKGSSKYDGIRIFQHTKIKDDKRLVECLNLIKDDLDKVKSTLSKTGADQTYIDRLAHTIPVALADKNNIGEAKKTLANIAKDALDDYRSRQFGRLFYVLGALAISVVTSIGAIIFYLLREDSFAIRNQVLVLLVTATAFSSFGGLLSIAMRLKELTLENVNAWYMYLTYGALRQLFSILGGISVVVLIKADLAFSIVSENIYAILSLCLLAGFSETLIPNTFRKMESEKS